MGRCEVKTRDALIDRLVTEICYVEICRQNFLLLNCTHAEHDQCHAIATTHIHSCVGCAGRTLTYSSAHYFARPAELKHVRWSIILHL